MHSRHSLILATALLVMSCHAPVRSVATATTGGTERDALFSGLTRTVELADRPPERFSLASRMAFYGVSAVSIAVIHHDALAWSAAIGTRQLGSADSINPHTIFQVASISKPVTAVGTMRLVEQGKLALDAPANAQLKSWRIPDTSFTARQPVLLEHLLSHTAGATNGAVGIYPPGAAVPTLLQALDGRAPSNRPPVRIDFVPGSRWRYAGGGYSIIQQMLIDVTGQPFPELMSSLVLDPLEMKESCFCQPLPASLAAKAAVGHDAAGKPIAGNWWTLPEMAAGGLWSTASDIARFVMAVNSAERSGKPGFMSRAIAQRMLTPVRDQWSLGFNVDSVGGWRRVSHTGSNNGYRSIFVDFPDRGEAIVILTNGDGGADLRDEILRSAAALYGWPGYAPMRLTPQPVAVSELAQFQGTYRYSAGFASTVAVEGDSLVARLNGGAPGRMYFEGRDTFFSIAGTRYTFQRGNDGAIAGVKVTFPGSAPLTGRRVP